MQLEVFYHLVNHPEREISKTRQHWVPACSPWAWTHVSPNTVFANTLLQKVRQEQCTVLLLVKVSGWMCLLQRYFLLFYLYSAVKHASVSGLRKTVNHRINKPEFQILRFRSNSSYVQIGAVEVKCTWFLFPEPCRRAPRERHEEVRPEHMNSFGNLSWMWYISSLLVCHWPKEVTRISLKSMVLEEKFIYPQITQRKVELN